MQQCGTSERKMAELTGFSRPYISMMREGKRCSPNYERIKCLIYNLNLTAKEEKEVIDAYWQERLGKDNIYIYEEIRELIESVNYINHTEDTLYQNDIHGKQHVLPEHQYIKGELNVIQYAYMILENQKPGVVRVIAPGQKEEFCHVMSQALYKNRDLYIEHIFTMDNEVSSREKNNIRIVKNVFSNVLNGNRYNAYYSYIKQQHCDINGLFPYCVLSNDYVMMISEDWKSAYMTSDLQLVESYQLQYEIKKNQSQPLFTQKADTEHLLDFVSAFISEAKIDTDESLYSLEYVPCLSLYLTTEILDAVQQDVPAELKMKTREYLKQVEKLYQHKGTTNYFAMDGLIEFAQTGRIATIPEELYRWFNPEERLVILENFLRDIKDNKIKVHIIGNQSMHYPSELAFYTNSEGNVCIYHMRNNNGNVFCINDKFARESIYQYLKYLDKSKYMLNKKETVQMIETLINDLRDGKYKHK